jgi:hypothetical protein
MSKGKKVTLFCGGGSACCPTATLRDDGSVLLEDDDGTTIELDSNQADLLKKALEDRACPSG